MAVKNELGVKKIKYPKMATAPYNFVSLPNNPLLHPVAENIEQEGNIQNKFSEYVKREGKYTGYIELNIKAITPIFICGEEKKDTLQFFTVENEADGEPIIPGSSIRGMIKNIFKVITCGVMRRGEDFEDRRLYFRRIMAATDEKNDDTLSKHYNELTDKDGSGTKPGFLIRTKDKGEYFICPAAASGKQNWMRPTAKMGAVYFHEKEKSADCVTGEMRNKNHAYTISNGDFRPQARLPMEESLNVVENYKADRTRRGVNLLDKNNALSGNSAGGFTNHKDIDLVVPCFYTEKGGFVQNFGHGPNYRVPYLKSIGDHVPSNLSEKEPPSDFADFVFGTKEYFASRVFFDDAKLKDAANFKNCRGPFDYPQPLLTPNPTSFQLYLEQKALVGKNHWDTPNTNIRGYKFFWHRIKNTKKEIWPIKDDQPKIKDAKQIRPLKKDTEFISKIRFENLSKEELGALCSAVCFKREGGKTAYKIGMGKSIGMGSVLIDAKLFLEDTDIRYFGLFAEGNEGWLEDIAEKDMTDFIDEFTKYRIQHLNENDGDKLEKILDELGELLNYDGKDNPEWLAKTEPMQIGKGDKRFINRIALKETLKFAKEKLV